MLLFIIVISFRPSQTLSQEWAIIELQGDLVSQTNSSFEGKFIGDLHYTKSGQPLLIIGHHLLRGKEVSLEKPLALLKRQAVDTSGIEFNVQCIITKKLLFKTRPTPIVGSD